MSAERTSRAAIAAEQLCAALWEALHEQLRAGRSEQAAALGERIAEVTRSVSQLAHADSDPPPPQQDHPRAKRRGSPAAGSLADAVLVDEQESADAPIAIRDARRGGDAAPWSAAVQRRLDRYDEDREPFAVLLVELLDAERLRLAQSPVDAERQLRDVETAIVEQLRPADALVREAHGRYWLIAPGSAALEARALALQLAAAVRRRSHRGAPLELAVGIAVCPEHGVETASLIGHAEVDLYASEAGGQVIGGPEDRDPAG